MNSSDFAEYAKGLESMANAGAKLNDAGVLPKERLEKVASVYNALLDKLEGALADIDLSVVAQPIQQPQTQQITQPVQLQPLQPLIQTPPAEPLFVGKTYKQLICMNTAPLLGLARIVSGYPGANPNIPMQGQQFENDWRLQVVDYITSQSQHEPK